MDIGSIDSDVIVLIGILAVLGKMAINDILSKINK